MNYDEALEYIHSTKRYNAKLNLNRIESFLAELGNPEKAMKYVHVAGTNGKGSTTAMTGSVLLKSGYKTGMFISPYFERFNERIQLGGKPISDAALAALTEKVKVYADGMGERGLIHPSEFELVAGMAFTFWRDEACDFVSLEVGLGGRLDATNVIDPPEVAVITSISFDHMHLLGSTIAEITYEKCGIIKRGSSVVCYCDQPPEAYEIIKRVCGERGAEFIFPDKNAAEIIDSGFYGSKIRYKGIETTVPLMGRHQVFNALGVIEAGLALKRRGYSVTEQSISEGISETEWAGRLEVISKDPLCILDAAHNRDAVRALGDAADDLLRGRELVAVMGMLADKEYDLCIPQIARRAATFIAVTPVSGRALPAGETAEIAREHCKDARTAGSIGEAVELAFKVAGKDKAILICGSFYVIGEAKRVLRTLIDTVNDKENMVAQ
ncbi:MAG: bifunctional folylpolyglutamate synthase/dihydrofolate synthase [Oscillospiraceae bacterium]|nr:bifunctional folylpolyglutamate synthase/dihydrofolate synthase [Oscillospiraceae bacterium]